MQRRGLSFSVKKSFVCEIMNEYVHHMSLMRNYVLLQCIERYRNIMLSHVNQNEQEEK